MTAARSQLRSTLDARTSDLDRPRRGEGRLGRGANGIGGIRPVFTIDRRIIIP